jgi:hypothetical protein
LLVSHFLGVDHIGHRFQSSHPAMANKLQQLDRVLREVFKAQVFSLCSLYLLLPPFFSSAAFLCSLLAFAFLFFCYSSFLHFFFLPFCLC